MLLSHSQVYELLASHELYVQTDRAIGKHHFQLTIRVLPSQRCVGFELQAMPVFPDGVVASDTIDPIVGLHRYQLINAANDLYLPQTYWHSFAALGLRLYETFRSNDILEVVIDVSFESFETTVIHHASLVADERAAYRHPYLADVPAFQRQIMDPMGHIVCISNGAGLIMTTVDAIRKLTVDATLPFSQLIELDDVTLLQHLAAQIEACVAEPTCTTLLIVMSCIEVSCQAVAQVIHEQALLALHCQFLVLLEGLEEEAIGGSLNVVNVQTMDSISTIAASLPLVTLGAQSQ